MDIHLKLVLTLITWGPEPAKKSWHGKSPPACHDTFKMLDTLFSPCVRIHVSLAYWLGAHYDGEMSNLLWPLTYYGAARPNKGSPKQECLVTLPRLWVGVRYALIIHMCNFICNPMYAHVSWNPRLCICTMCLQMQLHIPSTLHKGLDTRIEVIYTIQFSTYQVVNLIS